jgi:hypothetical protein
MEDELKRKHDACVDGLRVMANHNTELSGDTPLQTLATTLGTSIGKIDDYETKRVHNLGFEQKLKHDLQTMRGEGWAIAKLVEEYAKATHNDTLQHEVAFHKSDFSKGTYDDQKRNAQIVFDAADGAVVAAMVTAGYNITAARVTALGTAITDFAADMGTPRADIADTVAYGNAEKAEIKDVLMPTRQSILNLMASYAATNKVVYDAVLDGFEILDIGVRHIAIRVRVFDSVLNVRLPKATVTVSDNGEKKKSSENGIVDFSHQQCPQGNYSMTVALHGYGILTINNIPSYDDKMITLDVPLVKNGPDAVAQFRYVEGTRGVAN